MTQIKKTTLLAGLAALVILIVAMVVKWHYSPAVKDSYFVPDSDRLRQVPAGIVLVRPTHFAPSMHDGIKHVHDGDSLARTVGRNVPLRDVLAEAYDENPSRVVLPPDAPEGGFDFLVTAPGQTRKRLQTIISKDLGYVAHRETRTTTILVLAVNDPSLPGLKVSADNEEADIQYKDGRLFFTHQPLRVVLKGLEAGLTTPVQDQTGLTNFYDFSVIWNPHIQQSMQTGAIDPDGVKKVLSGWGLRLEPDTATLDMIIVAKAN